jgi:hypothetical protein
MRTYKVNVCSAEIPQSWDRTVRGKTIVSHSSRIRNKNHKQRKATRPQARSSLILNSDESTTSQARVLPRSPPERARSISQHEIQSDAGAEKKERKIEHPNSQTRSKLGHGNSAQFKTDSPARGAPGLPLIRPAPPRIPAGG